MSVEKGLVKNMPLFQLAKCGKQYICPKCQRILHFVEGQAVQIVDGRADMTASLPKYECSHCGVYFRELAGSGFFGEHDMPGKAAKMLKTKRFKNTGDLVPMKLKKDANNQCKCPRCGEMMDFVEAEAVHIVDGHADLENVKAHFYCPHCNSTFRRIAATNYFQWSEK